MSGGEPVLGLGAGRRSLPGFTLAAQEAGSFGFDDKQKGTAKAPEARDISSVSGGEPRLGLGQPRNCSMCPENRYT